MENVVRLPDYRQRNAEQQHDLAELAAMSYDAAVDWAGADFRRLVAVAKARDYRPEWIAHQLENHGERLSAHEAEALARLAAEAGPYLSRRRRWIMRQVRINALTEKALVTMAQTAVEYRGYKQVPKCVRHDIDGLVSLGLVRDHAGKIHAGSEAPRGTPSEHGAYTGILGAEWEFRKDHVSRSI